MTKEEKIIEAYGENWELVKDKVNKDGWIKDREFIFSDFVKGIDWQTTDHDDEWYYTRRPMLLKGIENNNGWHCLSEKDFPEDEQTVLWYSNKTNEFENASLLHCDFNFEEYTHWHELPTKSPIY